MFLVIQQWSRWQHRKSTKSHTDSQETTGVPQQICHILKFTGMPLILKLCLFSVITSEMQQVQMGCITVGFLCAWCLYSLKIPGKTSVIMTRNYLPETWLNKTRMRLFLKTSLLHRIPSEQVKKKNSLFLIHQEDVFDNTVSLNWHIKRQSEVGHTVKNDQI